jgi:hypothetical protein
VKHRIDKIFDHTLTGHHGLTNMDNLRSAFTNTMHAEYFVRLAVEEQLEHAEGIANNDALGSLPILGATRFVGTCAAVRRSSVSPTIEILGIIDVDAVVEKDVRHLLA